MEMGMVREEWTVASVRCVVDMRFPIVLGMWDILVEK